MPDETPNRPGRPLLLNEERQSRIVGALTVGATRKEAATYARVSYATLKRWLHIGRECAERYVDHDDETAMLDDPDWPFYALLAAVEEAESRPTLEALTTIGKAIRDDDWKAAAWFLRYVQQRGQLPDGSYNPDDDQALRDEGFAIVEEIKRRERAREDEAAAT